MVFMPSSKQMLAATDCEKSHRDRGSKHCIPFRKHQWTIRRSGQPVLVTCISLTDRHRHRALLRRPTRPLGRRGSHWIQATLTREGSPHYLRTTVLSSAFVRIGQVRRSRVLGNGGTEQATAHIKSPSYRKPSADCKGHQSEIHLRDR